jgi:C4-dicarboxylate-specific signal transduction histidine kinase
VQIQQVLFNLIHNAVEAFADSKEARRQVIVRTKRATPDKIEISVADNGPGIDPAVSGRIFEPFCTTKPEGAGLGLAVSRSIIQAHGGKLEHRRNHPAGACFFFLLPAIIL